MYLSKPILFIIIVVVLVLPLPLALNLVVAFLKYCVLYYL